MDEGMLQHKETAIHMPLVRSDGSIRDRDTLMINPLVNHFERTDGQSLVLACLMQIVLIMIGNSQRAESLITKTNPFSGSYPQPI